MRVPRISLGKLFNVLQSPIGRMASWPMRNIKTFPSKQMYLYLSLVERKEAEFYHNINRRRYLVCFKWLIFIAFPGQFMVSLRNRSYTIQMNHTSYLTAIVLNKAWIWEQLLCAWTVCCWMLEVGQIGQIVTNSPKTRRVAWRCWSGDGRGDDDNP